MLLEGRVAVVSGVGPGVGRSLAQTFAKEGADVALAARTQSALDSAADEVRALGRRALPIACDITQGEDCRRLVARTVEELGGIDVLVNNAFRSAPYELFETVDLEEWRKIFEVNVFGSLALTQAAVPELKRRGGGSVIFINSMSMRLVEPRFGGYAASKGALFIAARTLAKELGAHRIRVNSVVPGYIWGPALEGYFRSLAAQRSITVDAVYAEIAAKSALKHIATSEEVARAVLFFASDLSAAVTGQSLDVNAGEFFD